MSDAEVAVTAAQAGAAVVRSRYGQPVKRYAKTGGDFATAADIEAESAILDTLRTARPDDPALGEETGRTGDTEADRLWLVDPLCGTLNFAAQTPLVAVNVALRTGDGITVAAVADPFTEEVFWTDGKGAHVRHAGTDQPLTPTPDARLVDVNIDPPFHNGPGFRAVRLLNDVAFTQRFGGRVTSTTLALAWVAAGRRAAYVTDGTMRDNVHFASAIAVCQAAGCVVTDLRGRPLDAGAGGLLVSADQPTHDILLTIVGKQFRS
ncbi:inositol monophosphatase family protein [Micromonospora sp. CPCC 206061]|uniref:inositol monophosphatase family protein n=1 Tax=Micromonospora sp. CPCC 206061 TaxID=3122410 RepID=UPI002FEEAA70